jgi:hypothetical protein
MSNIPSQERVITVKFPTLGNIRAVKYLWIAHPLPLGLNIDRCVKANV